MSHSKSSAKSTEISIYAYRHAQLSSWQLSVSIVVDVDMHWILWSRLKHIQRVVSKSKLKSAIMFTISSINCMEARMCFIVSRTNHSAGDAARGYKARFGLLVWLVMSLWRPLDQDPSQCPFCRLRQLSVILHELVCGFRLVKTVVFTVKS